MILYFIFWFFLSDNIPTGNLAANHQLQGWFQEANIVQLMHYLGILFFDYLCSFHNNGEKTRIFTQCLLFSILLFHRCHSVQTKSWHFHRILVLPFSRIGRIFKNILRFFFFLVVYSCYLNFSFDSILFIWITYLSASQKCS